MPLFPLKLKPFERLFFFADRQENPSTFIYELEFAGPIQHELAESAIEHAAQIHPLSRCKIQCDGNKTSWVPANVAPKIDWCDQPVNRGNVTDIDLIITDGPPLRIFANDGSDSGSASLVVLFHHCAFDGLGASQWLEDFMINYRLLDANGSPAANKLDTTLLRRRCQPNLGWVTALRLLPGQWLSVRETFRVISRKVIPLVCPQSQSDSKQRCPRYLTFQLSENETRELKKLAGENQTSLNSIIVRDFLFAVSDWQAKRNTNANGSHFRVMIPINERGRKMKRLPACNHCTIINLDFQPSELREGDTVISEIDQTMSIIQKWRLSFNFWRAIKVFDWMPGGLKRHSDHDETNATALLTNIGRVFQKFVASKSSQTGSGKNGPLSVTNFHAYAPLARGVYGALLTYNFNNEQRISLHYNGRLISSDGANELMDGLRTQLLSNLA